jgi:hypothetical protein
MKEYLFPAASKESKDRCVVFQWGPQQVLTGYSCNMDACSLMPSAVVAFKSSVVGRWSSVQERTLKSKSADPVL